MFRNKNAVLLFIYIFVIKKEQNILSFLNSFSIIFLFLTHATTHLTVFLPEPFSKKPSTLCSLFIRHGPVTSARTEILFTYVAFYHLTTSRRLRRLVKPATGRLPWRECSSTKGTCSPGVVSCARGAGRGQITLKNTTITTAGNAGSTWARWKKDDVLVRVETFLRALRTPPLIEEKETREPIVSL